MTASGTRAADSRPHPCPNTAIPGLSQWADGLPTNAELVATIRALPQIRQALAAAEQNLDDAYKRMPADAIEFDASVITVSKDDLDAWLDAAIDATLAHAERCSPEQIAAEEAIRDAGWVVHDLKKMITFTDGHEIIDGVAIRIEHRTRYFETIQITSHATDVHRYVEADRNVDGTWAVELGNLDLGCDASTWTTMSDIAEVRQAGLEHILAPLREKVAEHG